MTTVLVVDDDFMVARVHRGFVEAVAGFEVVAVAHTGEAALVAVELHRPDLVLLDIHLPDMNGLDLLPLLREIQPDLDAIVISAANEVETVRRALRTGIVHYLIKPFSGADLRESLEHYQRTYPRLDHQGATQQQDVDRVFGHRTGPADVAARLPKRLSPETAELVAQALREAGADLSSSECADAVGLARVSVRRYLEYFVAVGRADVRLRYGGVGRPERRYLWRA
ncbi:MAG TPA: response regulator [Dermatophilaceae bacterium]|nr:response regulator [Dermatophilaceae bacterium]